MRRKRCEILRGLSGLHSICILYMILNRLSVGITFVTQRFGNMNVVAQEKQGELPSISIPLG